MAGDVRIASLDAVSPSFCPLRWSYLQIDLQHGRTKICCKTPFQAVTSQSLSTYGADAIFNNDYVRERRAEMLDGVRHPDCAACWQAESLGLESYRQSQAAKPIFREVAETIAATRQVDGVFPRHIEIVMRTTCDLSCAYCSPDYSSRWEREIQTKGPYPEDGGVPIVPAGSNAEGFADTFRNWLADHLDEVSYIQFNGGEPLIQDEFYDFLELTLSNRAADRLQLGIITNLNTPRSRLRQLEKLLPLVNERHRVRFGVSIDAVGPKAEYIRYGLQWERFDQNLRTLLTAIPSLDVQLAPTMSALNVSSCSDVISYAAQLRSSYQAHITFRPGLVMWPDFQSPLILLPDDYNAVSQAVELLTQLGLWSNLRDRLLEIPQAARRLTRVEKLRAAFYRWFTEYDQRRQLQFTEVFPELSEFWRRCAVAAEEQ